jgi:hypothetical protein
LGEVKPGAPVSPLAVDSSSQLGREHSFLTEEFDLQSVSQNQHLIAPLINGYRSL